jgi:predicted transcriptional regulator
MSADPTVALPPLQARIVALLRAEGPMTRATMVSKLQRARTTIYDSLEKLMERGLVTRAPRRARRQRGRPKVYFSLAE